MLARSHEIITPLNCILGAAQLLRLRDEASPLPTDVEFSSLVGIIEDSGQLLSSALGDILNFATVSQRDISLDLRPVNVRVLIEGALESCMKYVKAKDLLATYSLGSPLTVLMDMQRMEQVLVNLLKNACKFNRHGGDVHVAAEVNDKHLEISVKDSGVGMSHTVAEQISETNFFYQGDSSRTKRFGGLGLGLAITCKVVKAMGGSLNIKSTEGEGSHVTVRVPLLRKGPTGSRVSVVDHGNAAETETETTSGSLGSGTTTSEHIERTNSTSGSSARSSLSPGDDNWSNDDGSLVDEINEMSLDPLTVHDELQKPLPCVRNVVCLVDIDHETLAAQVRSTIEQNDGVVVTWDSADVTLAEVLITASRQAIRNRPHPFSMLPMIYVARPSARMTESLLPIDCSQVAVTPLKAVDLLQAVADRVVPLPKLASADVCVFSRQGSRDGGSTASVCRRSIGSSSQRSGKRYSIDNSQLLPAGTVMRSSFYASSDGATGRDGKFGSSSDMLARAFRRAPSATRISKDSQADGAAGGTCTAHTTQILVAEDNDINIKICTKILEHVCGEHARIDVVRDGRQALDALEGNPNYSLVLMDIHMPDMDGIEAAKEIRKIRPGTPIVALSADSTVQDECLRAGMRAFLRKPLKVSDIKDLLVTLKIDVSSST